MHRPCISALLKVFDALMFQYPAGACVMTRHCFHFHIALHPSLATKGEKKAHSNLLCLGSLPCPAYPFLVPFVPLVGSALTNAYKLTWTSQGKGARSVHVIITFVFPPACQSCTIRRLTFLPIFLHISPTLPSPSFLVSQLYSHKFWVLFDYTW